MSYETRIREIRSRVDVLNASIDDQRSPCLKAQLNLARRHLDDAEAALRTALESTPRDAMRWDHFADLNIHLAIQTCDNVHKLVVKDDGPGKVKKDWMRHWRL